MYFKGKWTGKQFVVRRLLGEGSSGQVYEVMSGGRIYALKKGFSAIDLQSEINRIEQFSKTQGSPLESYFLLADDAETDGEVVPFYVMRYVPGQSLSSYTENSPSISDLYRIGKQLLLWLQFIHKQGFIFGDLKPENIIITSKKDVHLIDYGGVTPIGNSVKEFTDGYDRSYWGAGGRQADPTFDLFSFAVTMIQIVSNRPIPMKQRSLTLLIDMIHSNERLRPWSPLLMDMLQGRIHSASDARRKWRQGLSLLSNRFEPDESNFGPWIHRIFATSCLLCLISLWLALGG
jgi:serine/threonine protein kinase